MFALKTLPAHTYICDLYPIKDEREQQEELFSLTRGLSPVQSQKEDSHIITPNATINHTRQSHRQFQVVQRSRRALYIAFTHLRLKVLLDGQILPTIDVLDY